VLSSAAQSGRRQTAAHLNERENGRGTAAPRRLASESTWVPRNATIAQASQRGRTFAARCPAMDALPRKLEPSVLINVSSPWRISSTHTEQHAALHTFPIRPRLTATEHDSTPLVNGRRTRPNVRRAQTSPPRSRWQPARRTGPRMHLQPPAAPTLVQSARPHRPTPPQSATSNTHLRVHHLARVPG
jgi:hypothetical protein